MKKKKKFMYRTEGVNLQGENRFQILTWTESNKRSRRVWSSESKEKIDHLYNDLLELGYEGVDNEKTSNI